MVRCCGGALGVIVSAPTANQDIDYIRLLDAGDMVYVTFIRNDFMVIYGYGYDGSQLWPEILIPERIAYSEYGDLALASDGSLLVSTPGRC